MATTIRTTRQTPFTKSDALREDATLNAETQSLAAWLKEQVLATVTASGVLAFVQQTHPDATLQRAPVVYEWVWFEEVEMFRLVCFDVATISYLPDGSMFDLRGVEPDVVVEPIPTDFVYDGTDSQLDAALKRLTSE